MEALLSVSFDNISSKDSIKIKKGLRQIEGLLAQLCLPRAASRASPNKRKSSSRTVSSEDTSSPKSLEQVASDPAFREFFRLQEGFEWNVATRLMSCLETLLGMPPNGQSNDLILRALDLLQGVLLLHPPSRSLFRRESYMTILLDLLDAANPATIQSQSLLVLVTALLATPANTRVFESLDGLLTVASLFKARATPRELKFKTVEFFYFYLMPERKEGEEEEEEEERAEEDGVARTTEEKQKMLARYLNKNVQELVRDLREDIVPFATAVGG